MKAVPVAVLLILTHSWSALGFAHAAIGDLLDNVKLAALSGGTQHLFSDSTANVFIFFKPGQQHSRDTLRQIALIQKEMAGKSVRWAGIVSDTIPVEEVRAEVALAGITMPVLIDQADSLYGELGVALQPVIGLADSQHRLVAYMPFARINYAEVIRARVRHLLKEITDDELAKVLDPPAATPGSPAVSARRRLVLAEKLYRSGQPAKAVENLRISIAEDSTNASAHLLLGRILAAHGNCAEAVLSFDRVLALNDTSSAAREGKEKCR